MSMTLLNCDNVLSCLQTTPPLLFLHPLIQLHLHTLMMVAEPPHYTQSSTTSSSITNNTQYQEEVKRVNATGSSRYGKVTIARVLGVWRSKYKNDNRALVVAAEPNRSPLTLPCTTSPPSRVVHLSYGLGGRHDSMWTKFVIFTPFSCQFTHWFLYYYPHIWCEWGANGERISNDNLIIELANNGNGRLRS